MYQYLLVKDWNWEIVIRLGMGLGIQKLNKQVEKQTLKSEYDSIP